MKAKRIIITLLAITLFILCSCTPEPQHEHTFATEWSYDSTDHWHAATCGHDEVADKASHTYGEETDLGNGFLSKKCSHCGYENIYAKELLLTLNPDNGDNPIQIPGKCGDKITLPTVTKSQNGITAESLNTTREYQLACWFDNGGNEYLPGSTYTFATSDVTLEAKYYVNIAVVQGDAHYTEFQNYFNGTGDYSTLNLEDVMVTILPGDIIGFIQAKPEESFAVPTEYITEGYILVDLDGNEYSPEYKSGQSDSILLKLPEVVTVIYKANGGTGEDITKKVPYGYSVNVVGEVFTFENHFFKDWNTKEDGTGTAYSGTGAFTADTTLYAQWVQAHTITFDANGREGWLGFEGSMEPITGINELVDVTLPKNAFVSSLEYLKCWNTKSDGSGTSYPDGYTGKFTSDVTLYAQWARKYEVLGQGPGGGIIFYDCDADNDTGNADGLTSYECGWRYLEAAPKDIKDSDDIETYIFGYYRTSNNGENLYVNGTTTYVEGTSDPNDGKCTGTAIGTGKANTEKLVKAMGDWRAYTSNAGSTSTRYYAAKVAKNYQSADWFLPSKDELNLMYTVLRQAGLGGFAFKPYASSSECGPDTCWRQNFLQGRQFETSRDEALRVRPIRAF